MSCIKFIEKQFFIDQTIAYSALKKEDDLGADKVQELIRSYPLDQNIHNWKNEHIKKYVARLIKDIENIPVTSSNIDIVKDLVGKIASLCCRCKQYLIEGLGSTKIDKELRKDIITRVIMTCPAHS